MPMLSSLIPEEFVIVQKFSPKTLPPSALLDPKLLLERAQGWWVIDPNKVIFTTRLITLYQGQIIADFHIGDTIKFKDDAAGHKRIHIELSPISNSPLLGREVHDIARWPIRRLNCNDVEVLPQS